MKVPTTPTSRRITTPPNSTHWCSGLALQPWRLVPPNPNTCWMPLGVGTTTPPRSVMRSGPDIVTMTSGMTSATTTTPAGFQLDHPREP